MVSPPSLVGLINEEKGKPHVRKHCALADFGAACAYHVAGVGAVRTSGRMWTKFGSSDAASASCPNCHYRETRGRIASHIDRPHRGQGRGRARVPHLGPLTRK